MENIVIDYRLVSHEKAQEIQIMSDIFSVSTLNTDKYNLGVCFEETDASRSFITVLAYLRAQSKNKKHSSIYFMNLMMLYSTCLITALL